MKQWGNVTLTPSRASPLLAPSGYIEGFNNRDIFATTSGNGALYTFVNGVLNAAVQDTATPARISRSLGFDLRISNIKFRTQVNTSTNDDACRFLLGFGAGFPIVALPFSETAIDPGRRPQFLAGAGGGFFGTAITIGVPYEFRFNIASGIDNSRCQIINLNTGANHFNGVLTGFNLDPQIINAMAFSIDAAVGLTCQTQYWNVEIR